ncbi:MAG: YezD family protein [Clostridia bacterium]|nr:YezD family protein [Clostridia bacterium]
MEKLQDKREAAIQKCLREIESELHSALKYGTLTIVVQDGIPVQIDKTEKKRFV